MAAAAFLSLVESPVPPSRPKQRFCSASCGGWYRNGRPGRPPTVDQPEALVPAVRHRHHRPARQRALLHTALRAQGLARIRPRGRPAAAGMTPSTARAATTTRAWRSRSRRGCAESSHSIRGSPPPRWRRGSASNRITCGRAAATSGPTGPRNDAQPLTPELLAALARRAGRPDFPKLEAQSRSSGYCARPVRLVGHVETCIGDGRRRVGARAPSPTASSVRRAATAAKPSARRARALPPRRLPPHRAGLRGGKGVPDTVTGHPAVFVTLTAPTFGARAHARTRLGRPAAPLPPSARRAHLPARRPAVGRRGSPRGRSQRPGEPLRLECFDHAGAVVWNNAPGELGGARRSTCRVSSPGSPGSRKNGSASTFAPPTSRSPNISAAGWCTCTP